MTKWYCTRDMTAPIPKPTILLVDREYLCVTHPPVKGFTYIGTGASLKESYDSWWILNVRGEGVYNGTL